MAPIKVAPTEGHQNTTEYFARSRFARWASLSSAISGSKGERCKSSSQKARQPVSAALRRPPATKGAGFLDFVGPPLSSHDASHSLSGGRIQLPHISYRSKISPMGHSFPLFLGVHLCAVSGISQNPLLWTKMRLEHNLRGSLAAFVRWWLEAIRSWWRCGDRKRQVGPGGPAYKQGSACAPSHAGEGAGVYTYLLSQALRHLEGNPKNYCWEGDNFLRWREGILRADIFTL